ncbi:MAG: adaptor protein MecA [Lachnospiraceae bacterium]|nr:adaptor protein MecA [Lachnospiraceae bacterium]
MKITKISDNEIRCVLSEEELVSFGINLDDILEKSEKTRDFFRQIMNLAARELGIDQSEGVHLASAQITVLKNNSLSIVFHSSDLTDALKRITGGDVQKLVKLKSDITQAIEQGGNNALTYEIKRDLLDMMEAQLKSEGNDSPEALSELNELRADLEAQAEEEGIKLEKEREETEKQCMVVRFSSIDDAIDYCARFNLPEEGITSSFFRSERENAWYLFILRGRMSEELFKKLKILSGEYGELMADNLSRRTFIADHSKMLFSGDAMEKLSMAVTT